MNLHKPDKDPGLEHNAPDKVKAESMPENPGLSAEQEDRADTTLPDAQQAGFWEWNILTGTMRTDRLWATQTGYSPEELMPMTIERWKEQLHPDDLEQVVRILEEYAAGKPGQCELKYRVRHKNGSWVNIVDRGRILLNAPNDQTLYMVGVRTSTGKNSRPATQSKGFDMSELRTLIENIPGTVYRIDTTGKATLLSDPPAFLNLSTPDEFETTLFKTLTMIHPDDRRMVSETYSKLRTEAQSVKISYRVLTQQQTVRWIEDQKTSMFSDHGVFSSIDGILFDITDRVTAMEETRRLESQVRKSQRLETIGTLAGGIAHDFNNILTPILGYAEMGLGTVEEDDPMHEYFTEIMQAAERAQSLVAQILTFSRAQDGKPAPVLVQDIIVEALKLLRPSLPSTITIEQHIDASCRNVLADPSQIHQVIVNLCTNAFHAMEYNGGTLTIGLKETQPSTDRKASLLNLQDKSYLELSVSDTGSGMDETTMERIFEPFFTTKSIEKGTGLGLSVVHGIVTSAGGRITVESHKEEGSTFHVYLPVIDNTVHFEHSRKLPFMKQSGSILFVDDEPSAVHMMTIMMKKLGFSIHAEHSPLEALRQFKIDPARYDLVITDLTMPDMTGIQLAAELHKLSPSTPVILMTGYGKVTDHDMPLSHYGISRLLKKPVKLVQLASTVNEVLTATNHRKVP